MKYIFTCFYVTLALIIFSLPEFSLFAQTTPTEICDNGIDDDNDGLIDLNDPDCDCPIIEPVSLIPNPSFEDKTCCPTNRGQMNCAVDWIQASEATTDYIHTCGWRGWDGLPVPMPIPDGNGCVGFRDGRFGNNGNNPNWKEYTGACLTSPLRAGIEYKFEFYIGFTHPQNSPPINVTFFGTNDCQYLPFGLGNSEHGCPTNGIGWQKLGNVMVSGANQWRRVTLTLVPPEDIYAIAIGPDCPQKSANTSLYYFFDNLILADAESFDFDILPTTHSCSDNLTLQVPRNDTVFYQWYKDGIALAGETEPELSRMYGNGAYQVGVQGVMGSCRYSGEYKFEKPYVLTQENITICEGDYYVFDNEFLEVGGIYYDTLKTIENCDSIIELNLNVFVDQADTVSVKIFPSEYYQIESRRYYDPGIFHASVKTQYGCDSTIILNLTHYKLYVPNAFTPNDDGVNDFFTVMGSLDLQSIDNFRVFNRWGNLIYHASSMNPNDQFQGWDGRTNGRPAPEGVYIFTADVIYDDGIARTTSGSFSLIR